MPEVVEAVATTEKYVPEVLPLHVCDLLPPRLGVSAVREIVRSIPELITVAASESRPLHKPAISHGGALQNPEIPTVLGDALRRAASMPASHGITYVRSDGNDLYQSYRELLTDAEHILAGLRRLGLKPQDPVVFQLDRNQDFIPVFWACALGGFLAAPISLPPTYNETNSAVSKLHNCWELLNRPLIVSGDKLLPELRCCAARLGIRDLRAASVDQLRSAPRDQDWYPARPDDVCLILFTSGSTGVPKGVQQSHRTLLSRSAATAERNKFDENEISLNWFPLDHVGGIVMFHLMDLFTCAHQIQVPTELILQNPLKWLDFIDRFQATITWAPNFAFGLVNDHATAIASRKWDLTSMRFILNGGEAIVAKTARRFLQVLAPHGLRPDAMHPSWGMSETCSGVVFSERCRCDIIRDEDSFVEVGGPIAGVSLRIVDGKDQDLQEGQIGRLQIKGATVTPGYYRNPELNRESFSDDGWFNTGDLAMLNDGRLTITGRAKDVIIINGVNFYSHEIEAIVEDVSDIDVSFTAACAVRLTGSDTDRLAVFFSTPAADWPGILDVIENIRETLLRRTGVDAEFLIPLAHEEIPKTTIGKIQRTKLRERFEAGEFADLLRDIDVHSANENTVPDWFYRKMWRRREAVAASPELRKGRYLVFADSFGMAERVCAQLEQEGSTCVRVLPGTAFEIAQSGVCTVGVASKTDYERLVSWAGPCDSVLHCWSYGRALAEPGIKPLRAAQQHGAYSLLLLIQAMAKAARSNSRVRLFTVTTGTQSVLGGDCTRPENAAIVGLLASAESETSWLACRQLDVVGGCVGDDAWDVLRELATNSSAMEVAYRGGSRWTMSLAKIDMLCQPTNPLPIKKGGLYLITGGLGGLGVIVAEHLIRNYHARLLLVGRTPVTEQSGIECEGPPAKTMRNLALLKQAGGEFLYRALDISDAEALESCVAEVERHWERDLDGVFHLAGSLASSADLNAHFDSIDDHSVAKETIESFETIFGAKLYGTWSVLQLLNQRTDALLVAFSSVNGIFGGAMLSAYSAANSALDALVSQYRQHDPNTYCFNWTMWDDIGMSKDTPAYSREASRRMGYHVIGKEQGINSMLASLCRAQGQIVVGLDQTNPQLRRYLKAEAYPCIQPVMYYVPRTTADVSKAATFPDLQQTRTRLVVLKELPRDESGNIDRLRLATRHVGHPEVESQSQIKPRSEIERRVARVWKEVLGASSIRVNDTFFQLGGDSLTAIRLVNRLRETFEVDLSLRALFETPTIAGLAAMLEEKITPRVHTTISAMPPASTDLPRQIDDLSDAEVDALLEVMLRDKAS